MLFLTPNQQCQSTEGTSTVIKSTTIKKKTPNPNKPRLNVNKLKQVTVQKTSYKITSARKPTVEVTPTMIWQQMTGWCKAVGEEINSTDLGQTVYMVLMSVSRNGSDRDRDGASKEPKLSRVKSRQYARSARRSTFLAST